MRKRTRVTAAVAAALIVTGSLAYGALAARSGGTVTVVATHLNNPRGVWAASDGSIYVAEAGKAGSVKVNKDTFLGFTSAVAKWNSSGLQRVVKHLGSVGGRDGTFTTGADDVAVDRAGTIYVAMTGAPCDLKLPPSVKGQVGQLLRVQGGGTE